MDGTLGGLNSRHPSCRYFLLKTFTFPLTTGHRCGNIFLAHDVTVGRGEMSEWFKELVLKTSDSQEPWVRIPLSPPPFLHRATYVYQLMPCRNTQVAIRGSPAKGVDGLNRARVRIPLSAPRCTVFVFLDENCASYFYRRFISTFLMAGHTMRC